MPIIYQKTKSGHVVSFNYSDEQFEQLKSAGAKIDFLNENSKEVQAYKAELAKREAAQAEAAAQVYANREITMRQGRRQLVQQGLLEAVQKAIDAMPEPQKTAANIEWEYSGTLKRSNPFVLGIGAALKLTHAQIDDLFDAAAKL